MIYTLIKHIFLALFKILFFIRIEGAENVPSGGGCLLCSNHASNWDPITLAVSIKRRTSFIAKEELFRFPVFGQIIRLLGAIPVNRGSVDASAAKAALSIIKKGGMVMVFPEGSRARHGRRLPFKKGPVRLAVMAGAKIIPAGISGSYRPFGRVRVRIGEPVDFSVYKKPSDDEISKLTEELKEKIYSLAEG